MLERKRTCIGQLLKEREGRYSPDDKMLSGLERLKKINFSGEIHISNRGSKTDMIIVEPGDLVISGINVAKGAVAVYQGEKPITATIHYSSYKFDKEQIDIEYFKRFVKSRSFIQALEVRGGIKTEIKPKHFLSIEIDLPDIKEQRTIVSFFKKVEDEIEELGFEILTQFRYLDILRQAVLQEAIEGKLTAEWRKQNSQLISGENHASKLLEKIKAEKERLIKESRIKRGKKQAPFNLSEILLNIPEAWSYPELDDITRIITDGTHQTPTYVENGRIFLSAQNVKPFKFMPERSRFVTEQAYLDYTRNIKAEKGDLLVGRVGSKGETAVIDIDLDFAFYVSLGLVKTFKELTVPQYLAIVMNSPYGFKYASGNMSSLGASAGNLNLGHIRSFPIPLPSFAEQQAIVEQVDKLMVIIDILEKQVTERKEQSGLLMQSVLRKAFEHNRA